MVQNDESLLSTPNVCHRLPEDSAYCSHLRTLPIGIATIFNKVSHHAQEKALESLKVAIKCFGLEMTHIIPLKIYWSKPIMWLYASIRKLSRRQRSEYIFVYSINDCPTLLGGN